MIAVHWFDRGTRPAVPARRIVSRALLTDTARAVGLTDFAVSRRGTDKPGLTAQGWEHSMSHSGHLSVCVVADSLVGIDVELIDVPRRARLGAETPERFFTTREQRAIARDPQVVLSIFTFKEAWVKHNGVGLGIGIGSFDRETVAAHHPDIAFTEVVLPGAVCTVCHRIGEAFTPRQVQLSSAAFVKWILRSGGAGVPLGLSHRAGLG
jgi:phosphopantetheinyl transferase